MRAGAGIRLRLCILGLALLHGCAVPGATLGDAVYLDSRRWLGPGPDFGGYSGLELSADGTLFTTVSDRGTIRQGRLTRDAEGRIVSVSAGPPLPLRGPSGAALSGKPADAEGLAIDDRGAIYVSLEGVPRIFRYDRAGGRAVPLEMPDWLRDLPENGGLEALAIDDRGRLYTLPEVGEGATVTLSRRDRSGGWDRPLTLTRDPDWRPVGADVGPDGRLYLLERGFHGVLGFSTRLRRFDLTGAASDAPRRGTVLVQTTAGRHDNLESVAIWRDGAGRLRATLLADDNQLFFQVTEFVDYLLPD